MDWRILVFYPKPEAKDKIDHYHPSLWPYLPAGSISKTCIKVRVSRAELINSLLTFKR
jgi:hypothetical protein